MKIKCPNCGTEFVPARDDDVTPIPSRILDDYEGVGYLLPKEIHNDNVKNFNQDKENKPMNTTTTFDMEALAKMVAGMINNNPVPTQSTETKPTDGGPWAKTSQFYGKELCGYMYNPYMVRRHLPRKFMDLMNKYDRNVDKGIRMTVSYMYSVIYMIDECKKLAMLEKRDPIAFAERKKFWSVKDCRGIFDEYFNNVLDYLNKLIKDCKPDSFVYVPGTRTRLEVKDRIAGHYRNGQPIIYKYTDSTYLDDIRTKKCQLRWCNSYDELYKFMNKIELVKLYDFEYETYTFDTYTRTWVPDTKKNHIGYKLSKRFIDGYKKAGAYYTAKNLIMFNCATFEGLTGRAAVDYLRGLLDDGTPGYVIYAKLKDVLGK